MEPRELLAKSAGALAAAIVPKRALTGIDTVKLGGFPAASLASVLRRDRCRRPLHQALRPGGMGTRDVMPASQSGHVPCAASVATTGAAQTPITINLRDSRAQFKFEGEQCQNRTSAFFGCIGPSLLSTPARSQARKRMVWLEIILEATSGIGHISSARGRFQQKWSTRNRRAEE
jgi:hypothetical protein